jgi:hypothetical protein
MLRNLRELCGYPIAATDREVGQVRSFFFDQAAAAKTAGGARRLAVRRSIEEAGFTVQDSTPMPMWAPVEVVLARNTQPQ